MCCRRQCIVLRAGSQGIQTTELFRTFQDVIVPEGPAVHCSTEATAVVPLTHRVDRLQNYHIFQAVTNHAGRLVLLAGAPGSPAGRNTGSTGEAHCSTVWSMASAG